MGEIQILEKDKINWLRKLSNNIRKTLINEANRNLSKDASAVFSGILLGDKSEISDEINEYFREGNMAHILAVSGAHVSYIMLALNIAFGKIQKRLYLISTIILLLFFIILTGCSPSVVRACIMAIIAIIAKLIHRKSDIYTNLGLSAFVILLINPYTILNIGFELTYLGTIGIVLLSKRITAFWEERFVNNEHKHSKLRLKNVIQDKLKKSIINLIIISVSVQILIAPIILINFNTISYNFLISGVISTPIFAGIMIVGILCLLVPFLRKLCFPILEILINSLIFISKFISNLPFAKIILPTPNLVWITAYYIVCIAIILSKNKTVLRVINNKFSVRKLLKKLIAILLTICITFECFQNIRPRELQIYFIDVGQGDSTLIVTPKNKTILIDGGGSVDYDIGKNILVPYLLDRGISSIDYMMISHFDNDHCGGLKYAIKTLKVKNILISKQSEISEEYMEIIQLAKEKNIHIIRVKQGDLVVIEKDINLKILYPSEQLEFDDLNNNSVVAKLVYKNFSMLFTGDIGVEAEDRLLQIYSAKTLKSTVLKVGHHGSKTSSGENFINTVNPTIALIGVGKDNNFGHPNGEVINRLNECGAKIYRTDENGEVSIFINKKGRIKLNKFIE